MTASLPIDEIIHQLLAIFIALEVIKIADREAGDAPVYQTLRPLLVSGLLYTAYKSVKVTSGKTTEPLPKPL